MKKNLIKKYIILFFVIMLPLTAAFLMGNYSYRSEKLGQGPWYDKYRQTFFEFEGDFTTREKIHRTMKYGLNSHYYLYDETPLYSETVQNDDEEDLFILEIYRALYQIREDNELIDRVEYLYTIYNVQYRKLRDAFVVDIGAREQIENANVPEISINVYEILDNSQDGRMGMVVMSQMMQVVPDYDADFDFKQGYSGHKRKDTDELVKCPLGFHRITETDWSGKIRCEIIVSVKEVLDEKDEPITTKVIEIELEDYHSNPENVTKNTLTKSYMQDLVNSDYFKWVFSHYLWWVSLIAFAIVGFITFSFYLAWLAEENQKNTNKRTRK